MGAASHPLLNFEGKTVVLTGTSSGMGAEGLRRFVDAGADVHSLDIAEPATGTTADDKPATGGRHRPYHTDIGDRRSIDRTIDQLPDRVDVLVNCAGIPNGGRFSSEQVMRVNWLGLRHLTEALLLRMGDGGAVVHVASTAGRDWLSRATELRQLMAATDFEDGLAWVAANPDVCGDGYVFSKQAVQFYTLWRSVQLLSRGIRMNSICPGITDTSIIADFRTGMGDEVIDQAKAIVGRLAEPSEMAPAMLFLADDASASYINGVNLNIDRGTGAARATGQTDPERIWGPVG
ncbi:MAG: coniferyl-alcohol dehydrogenase [Acidimicrobiales bacterium]